MSTATLPTLPLPSDLISQSYPPPLTLPTHRSIITDTHLRTILTLVETGHTLRESARMLNIEEATVRALTARDPVFFSHYARAKNAGIDAMVERAMSLPTEAMETGTKDFSGRVDPSAINAAKYTADAMRWYAAKMAPKLWGDKVSVEHTGPGGGPIQVQAVLANLSDEAFERLIAFRESMGQVAAAAPAQIEG